MIVAPGDGGIEIRCLTTWLRRFVLLLFFGPFPAKVGHA